MADLKRSALQATAIRLPHTKLREHSGQVLQSPWRTCHRLPDPAKPREHNKTLPVSQVHSERMVTMNIKMEVQYTDGYEKRFTESLLKQVSKRDGTERTEQETPQKRSA
jgi:hypothetical protein|nr:MAG TPA: hypothetical protein [Caudoviricetes sp.]DAS30280.1 MAG TPA: hypothetical protein [Caudoviricetes sp.]